MPQSRSQNTPASPEEVGTTDAQLIPDLSARQQQILALLRAGKVNKEIASELGIGLGTVKQHVVALFKKLNVSNRTMAVGRAAQQGRMGSAAANEGELERRPCAVLSYVLAGVSEKFGRKLHQILANHAYDQDAIYLSRREHGGDLIFGISHCSELLLPQALLAHKAIVDTLKPSPDEMNGLRCGMAAGTAVASIRREGGWSGEAIASATIAEARALAETVTAGYLAISDQARHLLATLGPVDRCSLQEMFALDQADLLPWRLDPSELRKPTLFGRDEEAAHLIEAIGKVAAGEGRTILIEGENGTGKSSLCRMAAAEILARQGAVSYGLCQPSADGYRIHDLKSGKIMSLTMLAMALHRSPRRRPQLWIIDNSHLIPPEALSELIHDVPSGQVRLFAGRRHPHLASNEIDYKIKLGRLSQAVIAQIVRHHLAGVTAAQLDIISQQAAGIPLFAVQLALAATGDLPLSLQVVVGSRLDRLGLDRSLLRQLASEPGKWTLPQLTRSMKEPKATVEASLNKAAAAGVVLQDDQGQWRFSHPLIRRVIMESGVEQV